MSDKPTPLDAIVIGGGPAGLTAAVYLGRFRRHCLVFEDGQSRARWIPTSHNIPGFAAGVGGTELLHALKLQALKYGAAIHPARVSRLTKRGDVFTVRANDEVFEAPYVLLATGVRDHLPEVEGATEAVTRGTLRICPICDAYEAIDKRIAVLGDGALGEREAHFLSNYSSQVTLLQTPSAATAASQTEAPDGIERIAVGFQDIRLENDRVLVQIGATQRAFDVLYLAMGCSTQHDLAVSLSAQCDEHGALKVNAHQETTVSRLYAAGDVVRGLNQVVVAAAESAIAATDIHNKLRGA